jgi:hypothetical protein
MQPYRDLSGQTGRPSGVLAWESGPGYLKVRFRSGDTYLYTRRKPGATRLARMQHLARAGRGLSTYISQHVREDYDRKL